MVALFSQRELLVDVTATPRDLWGVQRTLEHSTSLSTLVILRNLVKTVHFNLFNIHQLTVLTIFTLSDTKTTARRLLTPQSGATAGKRHHDHTAPIQEHS